MAKVNQSLELDKAIQEVDSLLAGKTSAAPIMKFIASAESDYGRYDPESALSYGPYQIDPIRYYDIAQNPDRINEERINKVNEFLRGKFSDPEFDIGKLATYNPETKGYSDVNLEYMRDPLVGSVLARLALMQDPGGLPYGEDALADYYMNFWGPAEQTEEKKLQAKEKFNLYNPKALSNQPVDDVMSGYNKVNNAFTTK
jgi:hypothetical protein